jgi:hypothetical protein
MTRTGLREAPIARHAFAKDQSSQQPIQVRHGTAQRPSRIALDALTVLEPPLGHRKGRAELLSAG